MPNATFDALVPTSEVATRFGVHVRTIHRWVDAGLLTPAVKGPGIRGALLFTPEEVERFANADDDVASA